jgi:hypothetical protein
MANQERHDRMILSMARDDARLKVKAREAKHKKARQSGYRQVRYRRFKGRREEAMEEETREAKRERVRKSIQIMASWLASQELANAEEGKPREASVEGGPEGRGANQSPKVVQGESETDIGQSRITSFFPLKRQFREGRECQ